MSFTKHSLLYLIPFYFLLASCCTNSEEGIEQNIASGIVLIVNESYVEVAFPDGKSMYFTEFDANGNIKGLVFEKDSLTLCTTYGTGFFISHEGEIATSAHIISAETENINTNQNITNLEKTLGRQKIQTEELLRQATEEYDYANSNEEVSYEDYYIARERKEAVEKTLNDLRHFLTVLTPDIEFIHHRRVRIAYNSTTITEPNELYLCEVRGVDLDHDLAVIQLENQKTPTDKHVFTIPNDDPLERYSLGERIRSYVGNDKNDEIYVCTSQPRGFLAGDELLGEDGEVSIITEGLDSDILPVTYHITTWMTQKTMENRVAYTIQLPPISNGAPVVNKKNELVAINCLDSLQNSSFGIRVEYLQKLTKNKP